MSLLALRDLSVAIDDTPILREVSLDVAPGRILGVIGESGSGKSMTALSILRLLPRGARMSGSVLLSGRDLGTLTEHEMGRVRGAEVGMVFQEPMTALNPLQTIGDQVSETLRLHDGALPRVARARARDVLDRVGLPAAEFPASRYPHELSGGQRQRVVIAMAIARRPRLLIADEPTTALDVTTQAQILRLVRKLVDQDGMGAIFITHDLAVVADLADDVAIMRHGEVVESGPLRQVFARMAHPYTRALFRASGHQPDRPPHRGEADLLQVSDVVRTYPGPRIGLWGRKAQKRAVDGVSFTLRHGENLGLVGESGCGKSTLTRAILGLEPVQGGRILLNDMPIQAGRVPPQVRSQLQVVFQDPYGSFNPRHQVQRLVSEPLRLLSQPPVGAARAEAVTQALEAVGLSGSDTEKYIHEFSGGQRQRIAIARALIIKPALIVLDEAVSALDVQVRAQILDLLAELTERFALSYLFISHDLHVVRRITDRVLVMKDGRIVEEGRTEDVFSNPQHAYTRALLAATPVLPEFPVPGASDDEALVQPTALDGS
ncbi:MAG: dipeptide ABC transporter ATP-binding protein [Pseudomonadota bacterium]